MPGPEHAPNRRENFELDPNVRHPPDGRTPPAPPREPPSRELGAAALRGAGVEAPREPPPQRRAPERCERDARDLGAAAMRNSVDKPRERDR